MFEHNNSCSNRQLPGDFLSKTLQALIISWSILLPLPEKHLIFQNK